MRIFFTLRKKNAQTSVEYILLLTAVVAIVLIGFKFYVPGFTQTANIYYNRVAVGIMGKPNRCGDGCCGLRAPEFGIFGDIVCHEKGDIFFVPFENCRKCPTDCGLCPP